MKKLVLAAAALVSFLSASTSNAQLTGPSALNIIRDDFSNNGYTVESGSNSMLMKDASGNIIFSVSQVNPQTVTLTSVVARTRKLTSEQESMLQRKIAHFNISSSVGTLWLDNATGEVTMEHHLNPRFVSPATMAKIAANFGDLVRTEEQVLMQ
jgi:hypothetical protein